MPIGWEQATASKGPLCRPRGVPEPGKADDGKEAEEADEDVEAEEAKESPKE